MWRVLPHYRCIYIIYSVSLFLNLYLFYFLLHSMFFIFSVFFYLSFFFLFCFLFFFFFSSRRRHTRSLRDWISDVCSSDLDEKVQDSRPGEAGQVPQLRAMPAVPRLAAEDGGAARALPRSDRGRAIRHGRQARAPLLGVPADVEAGGSDRRTFAPRDRQPARLPRRSRPLVSHPRPADAHALRRRVAAHQPGRGAGQRA